MMSLWQVKMLKNFVKERRVSVYTRYFSNFFLFFPGVTLSLSTQIDAKNFNEGGHKLGFCLELEA